MAGLVTLEALNIINEFRKDQGLPPIVVKEINCLCCLALFTSYDYPRERLCRNCRLNKEGDDETYHIPWDISNNY